MNRSLRLLYSVLLSLSLSFSLQAQASNLIQFQYRSLDGSTYLDCQFEKSPLESSTYNVFCGKGTGVRKDFTVQLSFKPIRFSPHLFYEVHVLSRRKVSDQGPLNASAEPKEEGTTIWIRASEGSIQSFVIHQRVEDSKGILAIHYSLGL